MSRTSPFGDVFSAGAAAFAEAYRAAAESAAAFDRDALSRVDVSGRDRESFLQNMLTNDVRKLEPGAGVEAAFLTNKGKLVSDLVVYREAEAEAEAEPERFLLELESERVEGLVAALGRYVISEDVRLASLAEVETRFSLEGPGAAAMLAGATRAREEEIASLGDLRCLSTLSGDVPLAIVAKLRESSPRFDVVVPREAARSVLSGLIEAGAVPGGEAVAETRRVEAGRPRFGVDMDDSHLPLEAGLDRAISFEKGCYIGQEYVVRLAHRGHLNRRLLGLRVEGDAPPPRGSRVLLESGADTGEVTSARFSPAEGASLALAYLRREAFEPGTKVTVVSDSGRFSAVVRSLPFTAPSR